MKLTTITWSEAIQVRKDREKEDEKYSEEYTELLDGAYKWFMDNIATDDRAVLHFEDACSMYGVESDDLLKRII